MIEKHLYSQGGIAFVLMLLVSFLVACATSDEPPPPGKPTPSANSGAMMLVVQPEGTPVPVHLYAPEPTADSVAPTRQTETEDFVPDATVLAEHVPPFLTFAGAQENTTFPIQVAEYIPAGYELDPWVVVVKGLPPQSDKTRGVIVRYIREDGGLPPLELLVEQYLAEEVSSGGLVPSAPEMVGAFEAQVYEIPEAGVVRLTWRDPEIGVVYDIQSPFEVEEALRVARSFKPLDE